jgi:hypothetical protein
MPSPTAISEKSFMVPSALFCIARKQPIATLLRPPPSVLPPP